MKREERASEGVANFPGLEIFKQGRRKKKTFLLGIDAILVLRDTTLFEPLLACMRICHPLRRSFLASQGRATPA